MNTVKQEFARKLREALERGGYEAKPAALEREFNLRYWGPPVTLHGVRRWLLGETLPTADKLQVLVEWLHLEPDFLFAGSGEGRESASARSRWDEAVRHHDAEMFEAFLALPSAQKKIVRDVILAFASANRVASDDA